ncbi:hypothetical protein BCV70DRAFT_157073 [Testicularia cyperi]|uniref:Uncharacterized protein n=1 Tax=Testicularia cyperi TaxID=1882483 RepID=A0A317XV57_9BASI|nr:hypothetical protein BCV70DRAFT_157073 [Testicularia cyperi]
MKVKLRVPLSSAPARDTSSPLANPIRGAPDYSDDEQDESGFADRTRAGAIDYDDAEDEDDDQNDDDDILDGDEQEEADELDEMDELEDESTPAPVSSTPTKRGRITLKPRSSKSAGGTVSPSVSQGSMSPTLGSSRGVAAKRSASIRVAQAQAMSVEELDALPAAKRRKTAKARGAAGPGRGWRKGLTKGQKPVYELPASERTPATFGDTRKGLRDSSTPSKADSPSNAAATASPSVGAATPAPREKAAGANATTAASTAASAAAASAVAAAAAAGAKTGPAVKIVSGTFLGDLSAKAGTAKNPGFRYPPLPSSRSGPPVLPLAKIPTAFQSVIPLERNQKRVRSWQKAKREVLSMGGRPWSVSVYYGGEDRGFEKKVEAAAAAAGAGAGAQAGAGKAAPGEGKAGTPVATASKASASVLDTENGAPGTDSRAGSATAGRSPERSIADTTAPRKASTPQPAAAAAAAAKGTVSPLPPPKHLAGLREAEQNWRGQSPAFLFGGR